MADARLHAVVSGRVQGVGFRYFVYRTAEDLGLNGWVRNTGGRDVEVVAEGDRTALETLLDHLRQGPRLARVDGVAVEWVEFRGESRGFRVTG